MSNYDDYDHFIGGMESLIIDDEDLDNKLLELQEYAERMENPDKEKEDSVIRRRRKDVDDGVKIFFENKRVYSDIELKRMQDEEDISYVHDYSENDIYHLSDEQKKKMDIDFNLRRSLLTLKGKYWNVPEYIRAMRIVMKGIKSIAKNNKLMSEESFMRRLSEGKIKIGAFSIPVLGNKSQFNMEMIATYIVDETMDESVFDKNKESLYDFDEFKTEEEREECLRREFTREEILEYSDIIDSNETTYMQTLNPKFIKRYLKTSSNRVIHKNPELLALSLIEKSMRKDYRSTHSDIFNSEDKKYNPYDKLVFRGDLRSEEDIKLFMMQKAVIDNTIPEFRRKRIMDLSKILETAKHMDPSVIRRLQSSIEIQEKMENKVDAKEKHKIQKKILNRLHQLNDSKDFKRTVKKYEKKLDKLDE